MRMVQRPVCLGGVLLHKSYCEAPDQKFWNINLVFAYMCFVIHNSVVGLATC